MKIREFFVKGHRASELSGEYTDDPENWIHVREVIPLDWSKVWLEYHKSHRSPLLQKNREILQKIVDRQLAGDDE